MPPTPEMQAYGLQAAMIGRSTLDEMITGAATIGHVLLRESQGGVWLAQLIVETGIPGVTSRVAAESRGPSRTPAAAIDAVLSEVAGWAV